MIPIQVPPRWPITQIGVAFTDHARIVGKQKQLLVLTEQSCRRKTIHSSDFAFVTITMIAPEPRSVAQAA
jgi:hypothetical protein